MVSGGESLRAAVAATVFSINVMAVMEVEPVELALAACLGTMATTENTWRRQSRAGVAGYLSSPPAFSKHCETSDLLQSNRPSDWITC